MVLVEFNVNDSEVHHALARRGHDRVRLQTTFRDVGQDIVGVVFILQCDVNIQINARHTAVIWQTLHHKLIQVCGG